MNSCFCDGDRLLTTKEAARWLKVSDSYLNKLRMSPGGPRFAKIGSNVRYRVRDLQDFVDAQSRRSVRIKVLMLLHLDI